MLCCSQRSKEVQAAEAGTIFTVDIGALAVRLTEEMSKYLADSEMKDWIMQELQNGFVSVPVKVDDNGRTY